MREEIDRTVEIEAEEWAGKRGLTFINKRELLREWRKYMYERSQWEKGLGFCPDHIDF